MVYSPELLPDAYAFTELWNELAYKNKLDGIYFIGINQLNWDHKKDGFQQKTIHQPSHYIKVLEKNIKFKIKNTIQRRLQYNKPFIVDYEDVVRSYDFRKFKDQVFIPTIIPNWDNTPRSGKRGWVFKNSSPAVFEKHLHSAAEYVIKNSQVPNVLFVKSWNEWAEGNYLEPDQEWGLGYLEAIRRVNKQINH